MAVTITSVEFRNYKALRHFSLRLQDINILVGPNNCGKSTIIGAFRVLAAGLRKARSRNPERVLVGDTVYPGYVIPEDQLAISTENVHTDYAEVDTSVSFRISNGNKLHIFFSERGRCLFVPEAQRKRIASPTGFKTEFPLDLAVVPVLGPLEHEEPAVEPATVQRNLHTHRASRHFRNFWLYYPEGFPDFADLVARTWPGMEIEQPDRTGDIVRMFCREKRMTRELFWSGFGFQIWCQLLTHISRAQNADLLVIDEPEIYLHPDVQRQLLGILRILGPKVLLATHSTEIMSEADPSEIVLIDKTERAGERLKDVAGIQSALEQIGSIQNITLTRLAKSRRILFVEGSDFDVLIKFARITGLHELASGTDIAAVALDGFSGWERIRSIVWGINRTLGTSLLIGVVLDRDYYSAEEIQSVEQNLTQHAALVHIHKWKELENYLLVPSVLQRAIRMVVRACDNRADHVPTLSDIEQILTDITEPMKNDVLAQIVAKRTAYFRAGPHDPATVTAEALRHFENQWNTLKTRLQVVSGKEVLRRLRERVQKEHGATLTVQRIVTAFRQDEIPSDLRELLHKLESFRTQVTFSAVPGEES